MSVVSVNLLWQKRFRGLAPIPPRCIQNDGVTLLIRPDEYEPRTYQVLAVGPDGGSRELSAVTVETIRKFESTPDGRLIIGITNDDLYLFREGRKARFLAERQLVFADVALAPGTGWHVSAFSDHLGTSHALAFGDANARLGWTKDLEHPVARLGISADGTALVAALQQFGLVAFDHQRSSLWRFPHPEPITALALGRTTPACIVGTGLGTVLSVDASGGVAWRASVGMTITGAAADETFATTAVIAWTESSQLLCCFDREGRLLWEHSPELRPSGVSFSPNGRFLVVSQVNGTVSVFELDFSAATSAPAPRELDRDLAHAAALQRSGDLTGAREAYAAILDRSPTHLEAARALHQLEDGMVAAISAEAARLIADNHPAAALARLEEARALRPWDEAVFAAAVECRRRIIEGQLQRASEAEQAGDWAGVEDELDAVLALDPGLLTAREGLARARSRRADALLAEGDTRLAADDLPGALALWRKSHALSPGESSERRLQVAEAQRCLTLGIQYYEAQRLPEAVFHLKKALALDPDNAQAERYLAYANGRTSDSQLADRFSRLE